MGVKISALPAGSNSASGDLFASVQSGTTKKVTTTQITAIETAARIAGDATNASAISTETTNRTNADATLQTDINTRIKNDGTVPLIANWATGGFKFTGLSAGTVNGDSVRYEQVLKVSGATIDQPMGGFKITGLGTPSASTDATTKGYVLGLKPTDLTLVTTAFNLNSQKIINLQDPSSAQDAVTLFYLKQQNLWNKNANNGSISVDSNNILITGTTHNQLDCSTIGNIAGNKTLTITTDVNKDNNFSLYFRPLTVSPASSLDIISGAIVLSPGFRTPIKVDILNGFVQGFQPYYYSAQDTGVPDLYKRWISVKYDFSNVGGAVSTITLDTVLPDNCIVLGKEAIIECKTAFTSGGSATIAWGITGTTIFFDTATAFGATPYTTQDLVKLCASGTTKKLVAGANSSVTITIGTAALTGGVATIHIPVLLNNI